MKLVEEKSDVIVEKIRVVEGIFLVVEEIVEPVVELRYKLLNYLS